MMNVVYLPHTLTSWPSLKNLWDMNYRSTTMHSSSLAILLQSTLTSCLMLLLSISMTYLLMHPQREENLVLNNDLTLTSITVVSSLPMLSLRLLHHKKLRGIGRLQKHRTLLSNFCKTDTTEVLCTMKGRRILSVPTMTHVKDSALELLWDTVANFANLVMAHHMATGVPTRDLPATGDTVIKNYLVVDHLALLDLPPPPPTDINPNHPTARSTLSPEGGNPDPGGNQDPEEGPDHHLIFTGTRSTMKKGPKTYTKSTLTLLASLTMRRGRKRRRLPWPGMHSFPGNVTLLDVKTGVLSCGTTAVPGVLRTHANIVVSVHRSLCQLMIKQGYHLMFLSIFLPLLSRMQVLLMEALLHTPHTEDLYQ